MIKLKVGVEHHNPLEKVVRVEPLTSYIGV